MLRENSLWNTRETHYCTIVVTFIANDMTQYIYNCSHSCFNLNQICLLRVSVIYKTREANALHGYTARFVVCRPLAVCFHGAADHLGHLEKVSPGKVLLFAAPVRASTSIAVKN